MALDLEAYGDPIPEGRAAALAQYANIVVHLPLEHQRPSCFTRESIVAILGGNKKLHHVE